MQIITAFCQTTEGCPRPAPAARHKSPIPTPSSQARCLLLRQKSIDQFLPIRFFLGPQYRTQDRAAVIHKEGGGDGGDVRQQGVIEGFVEQQVGVIGAGIADEARRFVQRRLVRAFHHIADDADDLEVRRVIFAGQLAQVRHLAEAGVAVGGPDVDHGQLGLGEDLLRDGAAVHIHSFKGDGVRAGRSWGGIARGGVLGFAAAAGQQSRFIVFSSEFYSKSYGGTLPKRIGGASIAWENSPCREQFEYKAGNRRREGGRCGTRTVRYHRFMK